MGDAGRPGSSCTADRTITRVATEVASPEAATPTTLTLCVPGLVPATMPEVLNWPCAPAVAVATTEEPGLLRGVSS